MANCSVLFIKICLSRIPLDHFVLCFCVHSSGCSFVQKAQHVEEAGGKAVLIADNAEDNDSQYLDMITDGSTAKPSIPALFLLGRDG